MTLRGRGFRTDERFLDRAAARQRMYEIGARLDALYAAGAITGYHSYLLGNEEDFLDHDVDRELIDVELPVVYFEVGYDVDRVGPEGHQAVVDELGLRLIVTDQGDG